LQAIIKPPRAKNVALETRIPLPLQDFDLGLQSASLQLSALLQTANEKALAIHLWISNFVLGEVGSLRVLLRRLRVSSVI
jgi:hypothetical protein